MNKAMLVYAIGATIAYIFFNVWNIFIKKKKTKISMLDFAYCIILGLFSGRFQIKIILVIGITLIIWLGIIGRKCDKNLKEKNEKILSRKNES